MSAKPETVFRKRVQSRLDKLANSWFESIQQKSIFGTPDILGCVNGFFVALELKATPTSKLSPLQEVKLQKIVNAHGIGLLVHPGNLDATMKLLHELSQRNTTP